MYFVYTRSCTPSQDVYTFRRFAAGSSSSAGDFAASFEVEAAPSAPFAGAAAAATGFFFFTTTPLSSAPFLAAGFGATGAGLGFGASAALGATAGGGFAASLAATALQHGRWASVGTRSGNRGGVRLEAVDLDGVGLAALALLLELALADRVEEEDLVLLERAELVREPVTLLPLLLLCLLRVPSARARVVGPRATRAHPVRGEFLFHVVAGSAPRVRIWQLERRTSARLRPSEMSSFGGGGGSWPSLRLHAYAAVSLSTPLPWRGERVGGPGVGGLPLLLAAGLCVVDVRLCHETRANSAG
jgi:hypothetical protein